MVGHLYGYAIQLTRSHHQFCLLSALQVRNLTMIGKGKLLHSMLLRGLLFSWSAVRGLDSNSRFLLYCTVRSRMALVTKGTCVGGLRFASSFAPLEQKAVDLLGNSYHQDEWSNLSPRIIDKLGRSLHRQVCKSQHQYHAACLLTNISPQHSIADQQCWLGSR
jgi:hypothetical protein